MVEQSSGYNMASSKVNKRLKADDFDESIMGDEFFIVLETA